MVCELEKWLRSASPAGKCFAGSRRVSPAREEFCQLEKRFTSSKSVSAARELFHLHEKHFACSEAFPRLEKCFANVAGKYVFFLQIVKLFKAFFGQILRLTWLLSLVKTQNLSF